MVMQSHVTANAKTGVVKTVSRPDITQAGTSVDDNEVPVKFLEDGDGVFNTSDIPRTLNWVIVRIEALSKTG